MRATYRALRAFLVTVFLIVLVSACVAGVSQADELGCEDEYQDAPFCSGASDQEPRTGSSDDCITDYLWPECEVRCYVDGELIPCPEWVTDHEAPRTDENDPWNSAEPEVELGPASVAEREVEPTSIVRVNAASAEELPATGFDALVLSLIGLCLAASGFFFARMGRR